MFRVEMRVNETWPEILHWKKSSQFGELQKENLEIESILVVNT